MNEQQRPRSSILFKLFSLRGDHELQSGLIKNVRLFVFALAVLMNLCEALLEFALARQPALYSRSWTAVNYAADE